MRVYITGINGMLGAALARSLVRDGHHVWGCDIRETYNGTFRRCDKVDIRDYEKLLESMRNYEPDAVVHAAAMLGVANTETYPRMCDDINVRGTSIVVKVANQVGAKHMLFLSSSEVYGNQSNLLSETSPLLGDNVYAIGKGNAEHIVMQEFKGRSVIARMFNCFGIGQVAQFLVPRAVVCFASDPSAKMPLYGNPDNLRSYCDADDAAYYLRGLLQSGKDGETYNVGSTERVTLGLALTTIRHCANPHHNPDSKAYRVLTTKYEDRAVARDIPNRLGDMSKLHATVERITTTFLFRIQLLCAMYEEDNLVLSSDWGYQRETGLL